MKKLALFFTASGAALLCPPASAATKQNLADNRRRTLAALLAAIIVTVGLLSLTPVAWAQAYLWTNFAGKPGGSGNHDGTGPAATFGFPADVVVDVNGNVYVADAGNNAIRKVTPAGVVTTFAGSITAPAGSADGTGSAARFYSPGGVAMDGSGNLYVADTGNQTIRKVTPAGVVTTLAGSAGMAGSTDGTGSAARFFDPEGLAVDGNGNAYVADSLNSTIRKITLAGVVTTLAGSAGMAGSTDGTGSAARFYYPNGVAVDGTGNVYVADSGNGTIRKVTPVGVVTTLAGSAGSFGSTDGTGSAARFYYPNEMAMDSNGIIYVPDGDTNTIRKVTPAGVVTTLAGSAASSGSTDGTGSAARFNEPGGVAVDGTGNVYVADSFNYTIRKITPAGVVTTLAGSPPSPASLDGSGYAGSADGTGSAARFYGPRGVAVAASGNVAPSGNLYAADFQNDTIRKVTAAGVVTTLAGSAGMPGSTDGSGSLARFNGPSGVAVDGNGNVYVADNSIYVEDSMTFITNCTIRKVTPAGVVSTFAGSAGTSGFVDGTGSAARFYDPMGVAVDSTGNVYVADTDNNAIRKITPAGVVTTLAGASSGAAGFVDGTGSAAQFNNPLGVAVDSNGNIYVADTRNDAIRKITSAGVVTTLAGASNGASGFADGTGSAARFDYPEGLAVDSSGNVYVADSDNHTIRKVTSTGVVTTLGGSPDLYGAADGIGTAASFSLPVGIAVSPSGLLFVTDNSEDRVVRGTTAFNDDFNGDGYPDYLLINASTLQTAIWHLTGTTILSKAYGPTLPSGWSVVDAADFDGDGNPDYLLFNASTGQTAIWYMSDNVEESTAYGPTLPAGWTVVGVGDFNGDGSPDLLLFNASTRQTAIWYLNDNVRIGTAYGPTLPAGWTVAGVADFNGDGMPDFLFFNANTLQTAIWYMNNNVFVSSSYGPTLPSGWAVLGAADFNADGMPDYVLFNASTLQTAIWYLNGPTHMGGAYGPTLPASWRLVAP